MGEAPAVAGAFAYGLSAALLLLLGWAHANTLALTPALIYGLGLVDERGRRRDLVLFTVALWSLLVAGHPETEMLALGLAAAFAVARLRTRRARRDGGTLRLLGRWAAGGAVAAALAAPFLLPAALYLPQSTRAHVVAQRSATLRGAGPWWGWRFPTSRAASLAALESRLVANVAPHAFGSTQFGTYWGPEVPHMDVAGFAGTVTLLGALLAFAPTRRASRFLQERPARVALVVLAATAMAQPPAWAWAVAWIPLLDSSGSSLRRAGVLLPFLLAFLAACTWERWRRGELRRWAVPAAAAAVGAVVAWAYLAHPPPGDPNALANLRRGTLALQLAVVVAGAALLLWRPAPARRPWAALALGLLVAGELAAIFGGINVMSSPRLFYPEGRAVRFLQRNLGDWRMVGDGIVYPPNMPSLSGIADVRVYDPMRPWAHYLLTRSVNNPAAPHAIHHATHPESPLFDLLGARFLVAGTGSPPPFGQPPVLRTANCWIYRRPHALPILFLPAAADVYRGGDWAEQVATIDDFAARALVQGVPGHQQDWRAGVPEAGRLDLADATGPGRDLVRADAAPPRAPAPRHQPLSGRRVAPPRRPRTPPDAPRQRRPRRRLAAAGRPPARPRLPASGLPRRDAVGGARPGGRGGLVAAAGGAGDLAPAELAGWRRLGLERQRPGIEGHPGALGPGGEVAVGALGVGGAAVASCAPARRGR